MNIYGIKDFRGVASRFSMHGTGLQVYYIGASALALYGAYNTSSLIKNCVINVSKVFFLSSIIPLGKGSLSFLNMRGNA